MATGGGDEKESGRKECEAAERAWQKRTSVGGKTEIITYLATRDVYSLERISVTCAPWLSWLQRPTVNRKVVSSSLTGADFFLVYLTTIIQILFRFPGQLGFLHELLIP